MPDKPYILQLQNLPGVWCEVERFPDRGAAVTAGREYLAAWSDGRVARVVFEVVSFEVLWGGVAR